MTNTTQIVVIGIFIFFLIVGVIVFAAFGTSNSTTAVVPVEIWGTMPSSLFTNIANTLNAGKPGTISINYTEIAPEQFESTLVNALADGNGPDAVLMPSELLLKEQKKLALISFSLLSERDFKDSYVQGSEILLTDKGSYGIPFLADPLVMYWNRDILNSNSIATPPTSWEQMLSLSEKLTKLSEDKSILSSTVAFGDYTNVDHAKEVLSTLMLQSGSPLIVRASDGNIKNMMASNLGYAINPVQTALDFYTQFANPLKSVYTWNRSLPSSKEAFLNGDLAFYFGPASEYREIQTKSPNLNFDVAPFPQPQNAQSKKTGGTIYSFSVLASSKNQKQAFQEISILTGSDVMTLAANATNLAPTRRDVLSNLPTNATLNVFWKSTPWITSWLDPDPIKSDSAFESSVSSVVTGRQKVDEASKTLSGQMDEILRNALPDNVN